MGQCEICFRYSRYIPHSPDRKIERINPILNKNHGWRWAWVSRLNQTKLWSWSNMGWSPRRHWACKFTISFPVNWPNKPKYALRQRNLAGTNPFYYYYYVSGFPASRDDNDEIYGAIHSCLQLLYKCSSKYGDKY